MRTPEVTKTKKGDKTIYAADGKVIRTSKRDYKFALFGLCKTQYNSETRQWKELEEGEWRFVGLGNNAQNLLNSWKNIFRCQRFHIETIK
jgi:hypothetical protein